MFWKVVIIWWIFFLLMIRGGDNWMIVWCVFLYKILCWISWSIKGVVFVLSFMFINKLWFLIFLILGCLSCSNVFNKNEFKCFDRLISCLFLSILSVVVDIVMVKGLLLNVELCVFGVRICMILLFVSIVDIGYKLLFNVLFKI